MLGRAHDGDGLIVDAVGHRGHLDRGGVGVHRRHPQLDAEQVAGLRVLVVDDVMTTGGSVRATLDALALLEADVIAVALLVDRSSASVDFGRPLFSLAQLDIQTWDVAELPDLCLSVAGVQCGHQRGQGPVIGDFEFCIGGLQLLGLLP